MLLIGGLFVGIGILLAGCRQLDSALVDAGPAIAPIDTWAADEDIIPTHCTEDVVAALTE